MQPSCSRAEKITYLFFLVVSFIHSWLQRRDDSQVTRTEGLERPLNGYWNA
jgi:hypothetical protein